MKKTLAFLTLIALIAALVLTANAVDEYTQGEVLFSEDFETTIDELTSRDNVTLEHGGSCAVDIVDGKLKMEVNSTDEVIYLDFAMSFPSKFVFSYRYMVETAAAGEGSAACFILYPNEFVRVLNNSNTGSTYKYTDGVANANAEIELETKMGTWYTLYTAVDTEAGTYTMLRKADGDNEYTVITENMKLQDVPRTPYLRLMTERNSAAVAYYDDLVIRAYGSNDGETAPAAEAPAETGSGAADEEVLFSEDFETTIDELTSRDNVTLEHGGSCAVDIVDGKLKMEVNSVDEVVYLDFMTTFPKKFTFSYRYMVETAVPGEGSAACFILYPNEFVRVLNNSNTGSTYKYTDGVANANAEIELETKMGVWYTLYTAVDTEAGTYTMLRKADGDSEYTVITENMKLQDVPRTPYLRLMTERNSAAVAYYDDLVISEYDPNPTVNVPVAEAPAEPETPVETPAEPEAPAESPVDEELEAKAEAPNTFDFGVIAAAVSMVSLAGFALTKKKH